jgi:hypothetical protein
MTRIARLLLCAFLVSTAAAAQSLSVEPQIDPVPAGLALVGVPQTSESFADIRGHSFKAGLDTLRYGHRDSALEVE